MIKKFFHTMSTFFCFLFVFVVVLKYFNIINSPLFFTLVLLIIVLGMLFSVLSKKEAFIAYIYIVFIILIFVSFRNS